MYYRFTDQRNRLTDQELLDDLRRVARRLRKSFVSQREYPQHGRSWPSVMIRRFGSWNRALRAAGLKPRRTNIPTEELFKNLRRVWDTLGRQPLKSELRRTLSEVSADTYQQRFGSWNGAVKAFVAWANAGRTGGKPPAPPPRAPRPRKTPRIPSLRLRYAVLHRDGFRCRACGRSPGKDPGVELQVDHIRPWNLGGPTTIENLRTLCESCNLGKGGVAWSPISNQ